MTEQMGLYDVMHNCRAMRRLSSEPVPEAVLLKLVAAAAQAATGSNQQGARWIIVRDAEQKKRIAALNRAASENFVKVRIERAEALPHHDAVRRRRMLNAVLWLAEHMHEISTLMIPCHQFEVPPTADDMCDAQSSVWPGVQNLLLAARAEGLGAVLHVVHPAGGAVDLVLELQPEADRPLVGVSYRVGDDVADDRARPVVTELMQALRR